MRINNDVLEHIGIVSVAGIGQTFANAKVNNLFKEVIDWSKGEGLENTKSVESMIKYFNTLDSDMNDTYRLIDASGGDIKKFNMFKDVEEVNSICLNYLLATSTTGDKEVNTAYDSSIGAVLKKLLENKKVFVRAYQENNQPLVALYRILVFSYIEMSFNLNKHVFALTAELNRDGLVNGSESGEASTMNEIGTNDSIASVDGDDDLSEVAPTNVVSSVTAENIIIGNGNYIINGSLTIVKDKDFDRFVEEMSAITKEDKSKMMRETACYSDEVIYKEISLAGVGKAIAKGYARFLFIIFGLARVITYYVMYCDYINKAKKVIGDSKTFYNSPHSYKSDDKREVIAKEIKIAEDKKKVALEKTEALVTKEMKEEAKDTKLSKLPKMSDIEFAI